jgi:hypothetical protein
MADVNFLSIGNPLDSETPPSSSGGTTTVNLNTTSIRYSAAFKPEKLVAVATLGITVSSTAGTPGQFKIALHKAGTNGQPEASPVSGGGGECSALFTPPAPTSWNNTHQVFDVSASGYTFEADTWYFIVLTRVDVLTTADTMTIHAGAQQLGGRVGYPFYYNSTDGTTWTVQSSSAGIPPISYASATEMFGLPWKTTFTGQYSNNTNEAGGGSERGIAFTIPTAWWSTYKIGGFDFMGRMGAAGGSYDVTLYNNTTPLQAITKDTDLRQGVVDYQLYKSTFNQGTLSTLNAGTEYICAVKANSAASNIAIFGIDVMSASHRRPLGLGLNARWCYREGSNAWQFLDTRVPWARLRFADITAPAGGGSNIVIPAGGLRGGFL